MWFAGDKPPTASSPPSTKNVKGNRKFVSASYLGPENLFKIPDGLDLENKSKVTDWSVQYNKLHIDYVDGTDEDIDPEVESESDLKTLMDVKIADMEDGPFNFYSEADDDDESA